MQGVRLEGSEIAGLIASWPDEVCDLALQLRDFVIELAPQLSETIAFHSLSYSKPGQPYGVIGGSVCMISLRGDRLFLSFIHGAFLPDPEGLLQGSGKAKRQIEIRSPKDIRSPAIKKLIRAGIAHDPRVTGRSARQ